jgi:hypothetical protein
MKKMLTINRGIDFCLQQFCWQQICCERSKLDKSRRFSDAQIKTSTWEKYKRVFLIVAESDWKINKSDIP